MNPIDTKRILTRLRDFAHGSKLRGLSRGSILLFALASLLIMSAGQTYIFFNHFAPRIAEANASLFNLLRDSTRLDVLRDVVRRLQSINTSLSAEEGPGDRFLTAMEEFDRNFMDTPRESLQELNSQLPEFEKQFPSASEQFTLLHAELKRLEGIYLIDYEGLMSDLDSPPWYLWPTSMVLEDRSGYLTAATYNRAMYLAMTGEIGTARVLLTGLHAQAEEPESVARVYYGLGRLQFEVYRNRPEPEFYLQSLQYLRRSLQSDPDFSLAKRLYDFLLSLDQAPPGSQMGEGDPTTPSEGEGAAIFEGDPLF